MAVKIIKLTDRDRNLLQAMVPDDPGALTKTIILGLLQAAFVAGLDEGARRVKQN